MANCILNDRLYCFRNSHVAQETETRVVPALHLIKRVLANAADSSDLVAMRKTRLDDGAAHVASSTKDL
jgi:hypothetical protein